MKLKLLPLLFLLIVLPSNAQVTLNTELKQQLDSILYKDQTLRELFDTNSSEDRKIEILREFGYTEKDFEKQGWGIVAFQDSINLAATEKIIAEYGYPGTSLVGEPTNTAAWYVIQHSKKIAQYFPLIQKAGDDGQVPVRLVAMMEDRLLMDQGKEQIYGTQVAGRKVGTTEEWFYFVWPIENAALVNQRRREKDFDLTVEENAKRLGVDYKVYTLKQIDSILNRL